MLKFRTQVITCKYKIIIQMVPSKAARGASLSTLKYFLANVKHRVSSVLFFPVFSYFLKNSYFFLFFSSFFRLSYYFFSKVKRGFQNKENQLLG